MEGAVRVVDDHGHDGVHGGEGRVACVLDKACSNAKLDADQEHLQPGRQDRGEEVLTMGDMGEETMTRHVAM